MTIFSDIKKAFKKIGGNAGAIGRIEKEFNEAKNTLQKLPRDIERASKRAWTRMDNMDGYIRKEFQGLGQQFEQLPETMKALAQEAVAEIIRAAGRKSLQTALEIIDTVAPDSISLTFGPVVIEVGDVFDKIETIRALAQNPPGRSQEITDAVISLAPASVHINLTVGLGFIVQSDSAQVGIDLGWSGDSVFEHLPALLEKCGVPK